MACSAELASPFEMQLKNSGLKNGMTKFAANLSLLFNEWPFEDRFSAARDAGFEAVEFSFPQGIAAVDVSKYLRRAGLKQVLATAPVRSGTKGTSALYGRASDFRDDFMRGLEYAIEGGSPLLHVLSGIVEQTNYQVSSEQFFENMAWAINEAAPYKIKVVIEAINKHSLPGYFIRSLPDAVSWTQRIQGLGLILDLYHAAMDGLDPITCVELYLPYSDHIQLAGYPGRQEPDASNLHLPIVIELIDKHQYMGWVGCEYQPADGTLRGLKWLDNFR
jgi:hydroxypyruvate isomerase